jgi:hypothetical protein
MMGEFSNRLLEFVNMLLSYPSGIYFLLISSNIPSNFVAHIYATAKHNKSSCLGLIL